MKFTKKIVLQKNHFIPAALIGYGWGVKNNNKKCRNYQISKLDWLGYCDKLERKGNVKIDDFIKKEPAENVCYSSMVTKSTEDVLFFKKIEENFINVVKELDNNLNINQKTVQESIRKYVTLELLRNPLVYLFKSHNETISMVQDFFQEDDKRLLFNNDLIKYKDEFENLKTLKNYFFLNIEIPKEESIFLGSLAILHNNYTLNSQKILAYLKEKNVKIEEELEHINFIILPIKKNIFLIGIENINGKFPKEKFNLFNENLILNLTRHWNWMQAISSTELVLSSDVNKDYFSNIIKIKNVKGMSKFLKKGHVDFYLNKIFEVKNIHSEYSELKNNLQKFEQDLQNEDKFCKFKFIDKISIQFIKGDNSLFEFEYMDLLEIKLSLFQSVETNKKMEVTHYYCIYIFILNNGMCLFVNDKSDDLSYLCDSINDLALNLEKKFNEPQPIFKNGVIVPNHYCYFNHKIMKSPTFRFLKKSIKTKEYKKNYMLKKEK